MAAFTAAFAQEVTVYDGTNTSNYVPVYGTWADAYNKCEFIMNADQLGDLPVGSTITGVKWYLNTAAAKAWGGNFQVFMKEVDATSLSDFTGTDGATVVWEGALDGTSGYLDLEFNQYYTYNGGNLLIGVYQIEKGTYTSTAFLGVGTEGASVSGYSSSSLDAIAATQRNFVPKTTFTYSTGQVYDKPQNLEISDITPNSAKLTWDAGGTETTWAVEYKKAADEEWTPETVSGTPELTLDGLTNGTAYDVRIKAVFADGESGWLPGSFMTPVCEASDMGEITYELTDTYGDGWNNNKLQIVYNGTVIQELTIQAVNGTPNDNLLTGTVALCYGVDYDLVWVPGNYGYETGFTITGPDGSVIYEWHGTGASSGGSPTSGTLTTFHISQVTCPRPTNLAASDIVYNGAKLTWTPGDEEQDAWEVAYGVGDFDVDAATPVAVSGEAKLELSSLAENTTYKAYVRGNCGEGNKSNWSDPVTFTTPLQFPLPTELEVSDITATTAKATWAGDAEKYNIRYRPAAGKQIVFSDDFENGMSNWTIYTDGEAPNTDGWYAFNAANSSIAAGAHGGDYVASAWSWSTNAYDANNWLITPQVTFGDNLSFWVVTNANYPDSYEVLLSTTGNAEEDFTVTLQDMAAASGQWNQVNISLAEYKGQTGYIAIHHVGNDNNYLFLDDFSIDSNLEAGEWTVKNDVTSGYVMGEDNNPALTPNTQYEVQVQGAYTDGNSQWTESVLFTTSDGLDVPTNLAVNNITHNSAEVSWDGIQDTYNLRYRTPAKADVKFFEGFEDGLDAWTLVDSDGDGINWMQFDPTNFNSGGFPAYEGQYAAMSRSWQSSALTPDQWMISPEIEDLGGTLRYYIVDDGANYQETYRIYVCTTGSTDIEDFEPVTDDMLSPNTTEWTEVEIDLSAYAGQSGRIAFRHYNCTDRDFMLFDAIGIYANEVPAGEWTTVEDVTSTYTIEGLDPETEYEVQVQGVLNDAKALTEWTASVNFTTLATPVEPAYYLVGTFNDWSQEDGMIEFVENKASAELEAGAEFKVITPAETEGQWIWYGGEDAYGAGYFLINNDVLGVNITLCDGANFRIENAGTYDFELVWSRDGVPALKVTQTSTGINTVGVDSNSNDWYNLNGQKLNGKPTTPGIYINGNKKVIIK